MELMSEEAWAKRARVLTQALMISGALNVGLLGTFFYFVFKEKETSVLQQESPKKRLSLAHNSDVLAGYSILSFEELLIRLEDQEIVEEGYTRRDLALAALTGFHHFNLDAALNGQIVQKRKIGFRSPDGKEEVYLTVYPGLLDYQYEAILQYARTERRPFSAEGLFLDIKHSPTPYDPTLLEAFWITPPFHMLSTLFGRVRPETTKEELLGLVIEGEWRTLAEFAKQNIDFSSQGCMDLLVQYLNMRSRVAAKLLLQVDPSYVLKRFDDHQIVVLLDLSEKTRESEAFARSLLTSGRSDAVWKKGAEKLYQWLGEPLPEPYDHKAVLARFFPHIGKIAEEKKEIVPDPKKKKIHIVQEKESLWKISRKYKVDLELLKKVNFLETDTLRPGQQLEIP
jgi:LysM repeat protein